MQVGHESEAGFRPSQRPFSVFEATRPNLNPMPDSAQLDLSINEQSACDAVGSDWYLQGSL
jgi:hypothetical protein